ncbi:hypothetical protein LTR16_001971 [Cryomyces antarcticus]|uniref:Sfi1 spindle body domain-containing protein n=1 Tax=Cryomyces antarcticus TaxID=329879 RepID=A0ABR0M865_9PEZI|nr:hypothetical protein LTR16_001971 [Cryomyces antarcticus]
MPSSTAADELPPLTDRDVEILYTIVTLAQGSPGPPFRALFAAYDTILAERGIEPDHDQIYFRFLLRMGEGRLDHDNGTLSERFQTLLEKMGIQIEVGAAAEDGLGEATNSTGGSGAGADQRPPTKAHLGQSRVLGRSRRASFNDTNLDSTWRSGDNAVLPDIRSRTQALLQEIPDRRRLSSSAADPGPLRTVRARSHSRDAHAPLLAQIPRSGRMTAKDFANNLQHYQRKRNASLSSQGSAQVLSYRGQRHNRGEQTHALESESTAYNTEDEAHYGLDQPPQHLDSQSAPFVPPELFQRPSETQMLADAETFQYHTLSKVARALLRRWCAQAVQSRQFRNNMYATAERYDRSILLRQAMEQWRSTLHEKRQAAETDRFFEHLERRANKARELFLLTKAFTHWAQSASDEVLRTSVARRHILRTKYFKAWRDITAVNELKVRRQGLKKFFAIWRNRTNMVLGDERKAVVLYQQNLTRRFYWSWFWSFCEKRAPVWSAAKLKKKFLSRWIDATLHQMETDAWVEKIRAVKEQSKALVRWRNRLHTVQQHEAAAAGFRRRELLSICLRSVQRAARLAPLALRMSQDVDTRVAWTALTIWSVRTRIASQAAAVDQLRVLRNAWTAWNDRLRCNALSSRVDDRVVLQALYRWVLAARLALFKRIVDQKMINTLLSRWRNKLRDFQSRAQQAELTFAESRKRRRLQSAMASWHAMCNRRRQMEQMALEFHNPRVARRTMEIWTGRLHHVQQLDRWASDARFYILATEALKRWKAAQASVRKVKRREAYATIRRRTKMALVRQCLATWSNKASKVTAIDRQAAQTYETRLLMVGTNIFDTWRNRSLRLSELSQLATSINHQRLRRQPLNTWVQRYRQQQALEKQAIAYYAEVIDTVAAGVLKNFNWQIFQIRRLQESAAALQKRNEEKHYRNMIRYWAERTAARRPQVTQAQDVDDGDRQGLLFQSLRLPTARKSVRMLDQRVTFEEGGEDDNDDIVNLHGFKDGVTGRAEDWTAFDDDFDISNLVQPTDPNAPNSHPSEPYHQPNTPVPGYLRTPSKRTVRAKARFKMSALASTTPAPMSGLKDMTALTPQVTPFERKLRAGYEGTTPAMGAGMGRRGVGIRGFGSSFLGGRSMGVGGRWEHGFRDISEDKSFHAKSS